MPVRAGQLIHRAMRVCFEIVFLRNACACMHALKSQIPGETARRGENRAERGVFGERESKKERTAACTDKARKCEVD